MTGPRELPRIVTDRKGARLTLRHIRPDDWQALQRGYDMYSDRQKRLRMLDTVPHLTDEMAKAFATIRDPEHEFCLILTPEEDDGDMLGGARLMGAPGRDDAEFSVSIRADQQGRGLGRLALGAALEEGRARGLTRVWGIIARRNQAMLALARTLGFEIRPDADDLSLLIAERSI
ncbi:MAG: GNAT family N-acetyltransferase [Paracoccaceae bacterium]